MTDTAYYTAVANLLASLQVPVTETASLRAMADLMDETTVRGKAAQAAEALKESGSDAG